MGIGQLLFIMRKRPYDINFKIFQEYLGQLVINLYGQIRPILGWKWDWSQVAIVVICDMLPGVKIVITCDNCDHPRHMLPDMKIVITCDTCNHPWQVHLNVTIVTYVATCDNYEQIWQLWIHVTSVITLSPYHSNLNTPTPKVSIGS